MPKLDIPESVMLWMAGGERGISSETIVSHIYGLPGPRWGKSHPHDPDDLYRCIKLLQGSPETADRFSEMRTASPEWRTLVDHWDELERLFFSEVPTDRYHWSAPHTYRRMRELFGECQHRASSGES